MSYAPGFILLAEKYPEIKKLMGPDPLMKYLITALVIFNIVSSYFVSRVFDLSYLWTTVLAYCVGGIVNHSIILGIHELSHNVVFGNSRPTANRLFGIFANLPVGIPMSISFKKYHIEHHRYMGIQGYDVDLPTDFEGWFFHNSFTKFFWVLLQPAFYSLRPFVVRPKPPTKLEILNTVAQVVFDVLLVYFCGIKALYYLVIGTLLALGLHPMAAHFIAEHYMFDRGQETYSYYGPWNYLTWNVGYHMEHHDFPYIPGSRLPEVKRIAAEFYDSLPQHESWVAVIWEFIFNPEYGPYGRVKREYEDMYGEKRKTNPYLKADNTMKPVLPGDPIVELVTKED